MIRIPLMPSARQIQPSSARLTRAVQCAEATKATGGTH
jgi:hypothetical protein